MNPLNISKQQKNVDLFKDIVQIKSIVALQELKTWSC